MTVEVTDASELRLEEVADYLSERNAEYWGYDTRAITEAVCNIYGEVQKSSEVLALVVKKPSA